MPDPESVQLEFLGTSPDDAPTARAERWFARRAVQVLSGLLVLALAAAAGLGVLVYRDRRDTRTAAEKERIAAADAWVTAMNAHDLKAIHTSMTTTGRMVFLGRTGAEDGPVGFPTLDGVLTTFFADGIHLTVLRDPQAGRGTSENEVWALVHMHRGTDDQTNLTLFHLFPESGTWKVDVVAVHY